MKVLFSFLILFVTSFLWGQKIVKKTGKEGAKFVVSGGSPVFVILTQPVVNIDEYKVRERVELEKNFAPVKAFLLEGTELVFQNKSLQRFELPVFSDVSAKVFYWDGQVDSEPIEYEGFIRSTEYFSDVLGEYKQSSYVLEYEQNIQKINNTGPENITKKSKEVSDALVNYIARAMLYDFERAEYLQINYNFKGIKKIYKEVEGKIEFPNITVDFTTDGLPKLIAVNDHKIELVYENGLVREDALSENSRIIYTDDILHDIGEDGITKYYLKNGVLLSRDDNYFTDFYEHSWRETTLEGNILYYKEDGGLNNITIEILGNRKKALTPVKAYFASEDLTMTLEEISPNLWKREDRSEHYENLDITYKLNADQRIGEIEYLELVKDQKTNKTVVTYRYDYY